MGRDDEMVVARLRAHYFLIEAHQSRRGLNVGVLLRIEPSEKRLRQGPLQNVASIGSDLDGESSCPQDVDDVPTPYALGRIGVELGFQTFRSKILAKGFGQNANTIIDKIDLAPRISVANRSGKFGRNQDPARLQVLRDPVGARLKVFDVMKDAVGMDNLELFTKRRRVVEVHNMQVAIRSLDLSAAINRSRRDIDANAARNPSVIYETAQLVAAQASYLKHGRGRDRRQGLLH